MPMSERFGHHRPEASTGVSASVEQSLHLWQEGEGKNKGTIEELWNKI